MGDVTITVGESKSLYADQSLPIEGVDYVVKTVTVEPEAGDGNADASFKVSTGATGATVTPAKGGGKDTKFVVSLIDGGTNVISVTVVAANGYVEGEPVEVATITRIAAQVEAAISGVAGSTSISWVRTGPRLTLP